MRTTSSHLQMTTSSTTPSPVTFAPVSIPESDTTIAFPPSENWQSLLETPCSFAPTHFQYVMENLLRNPNITSSCLFRADILYDSDKDPDANLDDADAPVEGLVKYLKSELRPRHLLSFDGYQRRRVVVRTLVPRNPSLDKELVQSVWILSKKQKVSPTHEGAIRAAESEEEEEQKHNLVIYIPHASDPDSIPYYHPKVHSLALLHTFRPALHSGSLSIHYRTFNTNMPPSLSDDSVLVQPPLTKRLHRTALNLLRIIHKHASGQQAGYKKRVHHDRLVDQVTFQDTYVRLKQKYAKHLMETWVEVTDPKKHVFEDIGIAAFLIEIWRGMYGDGRKQTVEDRFCGILGSKETQTSRKGFPGFVDIGCGNGVLVFILLSEGYQGWGFDVRRRKSWSVFPEFVQAQLQELVLVPEILRQKVNDSEGLGFLDLAGTHNGVFAPGTFIVSNHADQLTPWTPLLAYLSNSPFVSIPCCSHALNGKLSRFYDTLPGTDDRVTESATSSKSSISTQQSGNCDDKVDAMQSLTLNHDHPQKPPSSEVIVQIGPGPMTGSLARHPTTMTRKSAMPSAYSGFTAYVVRIATSLDFKVESEVLRIPSTRNHSIVSRQPPVGAPDSQQERNAIVLDLLNREIADVSVAAKEWIEGAITIKRKAGGH